MQDQDPELLLWKLGTGQNKKQTKQPGQTENIQIVRALQGSWKIIFQKKYFHRFKKNTRIIFTKKYLIKNIL